MGSSDRLVHFRIRDVLEPVPAEILMQLFGDHLLQGRVLDVSDRGSERGAILVVQIDELARWVVVPAEVARVSLAGGL